MMELGSRNIRPYLRVIDGKLAGRDWFLDKHTSVDPFLLVFYLGDCREAMKELRNFTTFKDCMLKRAAVVNAHAPGALSSVMLASSIEPIEDYLNDRSGYRIVDAQALVTEDDGPPSLLSQPLCYFQRPPVTSQV
jgi:hypothetical protein